jgi:hypothetical protein
MGLAWSVLQHIWGLDNPAGPWYTFWSGFGSDVGEFAIFGALLSVYLRHACHVDGCWRIGRHPVEGTSYTVCKHHHPDGAPTHEQVLQRHQQAHLRPEELSAGLERHAEELHIR